MNKRTATPISRDEQILINRTEARDAFEARKAQVRTARDAARTGQEVSKGYQKAYFAAREACAAGTGTREAQEDAHSAYLTSCEAYEVLLASYKRVV